MFVGSVCIAISVSSILILCLWVQYVLLLVFPPFFSHVTNLVVVSVYAIINLLCC